MSSHIDNPTLTLHYIMKICGASEISTEPEVQKFCNAANAAFEFLNSRFPL